MQIYKLKKTVIILKNKTIILFQKLLPFIIFHLFRLILFSFYFFLPLILMATYFLSQRNKPMVGYQGYSYNFHWEKNGVKNCRCCKMVGFYNVIKINIKLKGCKGKLTTQENTEPTIKKDHNDFCLPDPSKITITKAVSDLKVAV